MSQAPDSDDPRTVRLTQPGADEVRALVTTGGHTLPSGTLIRDHEISSLIGEGGFGIVYLAYDHSLQRAVALKEYMPSSMATRVNGSSEVRVKSPRHAETFGAGLKSFVNEARLLARFDHPALVKVYRFWEQNGTAYMVMPYYEGPTLKSALASRDAPPDEAQLRAWLRPLLDALGVMHAAHCFHRDIAPDNILLTPGGPLLLDFGAARRVIGDMTHDLTVVLKPGFAPIEQYGDVATMAQGAWTDLYALACVVHFAITGKVPMSSVERLMDDRLEPLGRVAAGRYSAAFLKAIDAALAVRPHDRPQSAAQFNILLEGGRLEAAGSSGPTGSTATTATTATTASMASTASTATAASRVPHSGPPHVNAVERAALTSPFPSTAATPAAVAIASTQTGPRTGPSRRLWTIAGLGGLVIAAVMVAITARPGPTAAPEREPTAAPERTPLVNETPVIAVPTAPAVALPPPASAVAMPSHDPGTAIAPVILPPAPVLPSPANEVVNPGTAPPREAQAPRPTRTPPADKRPQLESAPVTATAPRDKPARPAGTQSRCSDILQRASLEPLTAEETAYLKRECR